MKTDKWIKLLNRDCSLAFSCEVVHSNNYLLKKEIGYSINHFWYDSITNSVYYLESELLGLGRVIKIKIKTDPDFIKKNIVNCYKKGENLLLFSQKLTEYKNLKLLSEQDLLSLLTNFREKYLAFMPYATYPHAIERYIHNSIRNELKNILNNKLTEIETIYQILTTPTKLDNQQQIDLLNSATFCLKRIRSLVEQANKLKVKYGWLSFWTVTAKELTTNYYENAIKDLLLKNINLDNEITKLKNKEKSLQQTLEKKLDEIRATNYLKDLVTCLQEYIFLRTYRKNIISKAHFNHLSLLKEIGNRLGINELIFYLSYEEIIDYLKNNIKPDINELTHRKNGYAVYSKLGKTEIISNIKKIFKLKKKIRKVKKNDLFKKIIVKGSIACKGKAVGRACIVKSIDEINKIKKNDILITPMTTPDFVPVLNKVSAIVTDEGGIACHAAIVAREFCIPCIVGTYNATKIFKDNDLVEIDAEKGICKKI